MRAALALLTYVPSGAHRQVRRRLPRAVATLESTGFPGAVFVVDDGSADREHLRYLASLDSRYRVARREKNGGIWRAKNTCLRLLMQHGFDVAILAEDDAEFRPGWHQQYLQAHAAARAVHHYSWAWDDDPSGRMQKRRRMIDGYTIVETTHVNGVLLTFTPEVVQRVGGFKPLPGRWGHTHTNWTLRIIEAGLAPFFADVLDSNRYVGINRYGACSAVPTHEKDRCRKLNEAPARDLSRIYFPIEE